MVLVSYRVPGIVWVPYVVVSVCPWLQLQAGPSPAAMTTVQGRCEGHVRAPWAFRECAVSGIDCPPRGSLPGGGVQTRTCPCTLGLQTLPCGTSLSHQLGCSGHIQPSLRLLWSPSKATRDDYRAGVPGKQVGLLLPRWSELSPLHAGCTKVSSSSICSMDTVCGWLDGTRRPCLLPCGTQHSGKREVVQMFTASYLDLWDEVQLVIREAIIPRAPKRVAVFTY